MSLPEDIPLVTESAEEFLSQKQVIDYREERKETLSWLLTFGKDPEHAEGYAEATVKTSAYRMDQFYRYIWQEEGGYTTNISTDHADSWMRSLAQADYSGTHKSNCQKAIKMLFTWWQHQRGGAEWNPEITFSSSQSHQPKDFLTRKERNLIRNAALEYASIPGYANLTPAERDRWKQYLAQRLEKPKTEIKPADWEKANSWKIPSIVSTSLDAGLRPVEVERAKTTWIDVDNSVLRIPREDSAKSREAWIVSLRDRTAEFLDRWLSQRETRPKYDERNTLWLTRENNPYSSHSLRYLLHKLCEIAGIETQGRQMSWYAIRHSVGTYMSREEGLAAAQTQLRHKSSETTMIYDQAPVEDRQNALDRMG